MIDENVEIGDWVAAVNINKYQEFSDEQLIEIMKNNGDPKVVDDIKSVLVVRNLNLVNYVIAQFSMPVSKDDPDVKSQAIMGILTALQNFDNNKGSFRVYAMFWVRAYLLNYLKNMSQIMRIPHNVSENKFYASIRAGVENFYSIDENYFDSDDDISSYIPGDDSGLDHVEKTKKLRVLLSKYLTSEEIEVVILKFIEEYSVREISRITRLPQSKINTILRNAMTKLRKPSIASVVQSWENM